MKLLLAFAAVCLVATLQARNLDRRQAKPCPDDCEHLPLEIAFVIDASASIWPQNFTIGLWFVQNFVDKFNIGQDKVRVSAVTYGDRVYTENAFGFGEYSDKESLDNAIESIP
ncbi:collagen alpha-1(XXI) chain, partial [Aplysia californica]|uniref:Collagen alpha-1(XXI) chain n=1 Tax=Aplysia californica TaxID=6500 RepID=A0ABM0ZXR1_APLCA